MRWGGNNPPGVGPITCSPFSGLAEPVSPQDWRWFVALTSRPEASGRGGEGSPGQAHSS